LTRNTLLLCVFAGVIALACGVGFFAWRDPPLRPDFTLPDLQGRPHHMTDFDGRVVLINFWAPWCEPCRREIPLLVKLQEQYENKGLRILGPALDDEPRVREFVAEQSINYPVLVGPNEVAQVQDLFGVSVLPFTVVIARNGRIAYEQAGELEPAEIEKIVLDLL
jgi:thiol-disulfide isomerase/thioredoxin